MFRVPCQHIADYYQHMWEKQHCIGYNLLRHGYRRWAAMDYHLGNGNNLYGEDIMNSIIENARLRAENLRLQEENARLLATQPPPEPEEDWESSAEWYDSGCSIDDDGWYSSSC